MIKYEKPRIVVSSCLEFRKCRYNGDVIPSSIVKALNEELKLLHVCPEVGIGMGIPRNPVSIVLKKGKKHLVQNDSNSDYTKEMNEFSAKYLDSLKDIDGFILKSKSPSCGINDAKIYTDNDVRYVNGKGSGLFAEYVLKNFPDSAIESEARLTNLNIRENFLIKIFTFARFRKVKKLNSLNKLIEFHSDNKLLFMSYNQSKLKILGRIAANSENRNTELIISEYEKLLKEMFIRPTTRGRNINALQHIFGYFSDYLNQREKKYFFNELELYQSSKITLTSLKSILFAWVMKYDEKYLETQSFFRPFPGNLLDLSNTGKN